MDPSQGMVEAAQTAIESDIASLLGEAGTDAEAVNNVQNSKVDYAQGSAEDLESLEKESLDLVTAGKPSHVICSH